MDEQSRVASFVAKNELEAPAAYRLLDAVSELGEVSKAVCTSTGYGSDPEEVKVPEDERGDALFALLALCADLDVDAGTALETSLSKYEDRLAETGDAGSGE